MDNAGAEGGGDDGLCGGVKYSPVVEDDHAVLEMSSVDSAHSPSSPLRSSFK